jgi:hypothetical protein
MNFYQTTQSCIQEDTTLSFLCIVGTNISGALRKALQLAAKQQYDADGKSVKNWDLGSQGHPQPMLLFLTDGIATVGELLTSRILSQARALNSEIRVIYYE